MNRTQKRKLALLVICALLAGIFPVKNKFTGNTAIAAEDYELSGPRTQLDSSGNVLAATWDCVWFGNYWQNNTNGDNWPDRDDQKEPIKWRVLEVNGNDAFLLADSILEAQPYNDTNGVLDRDAVITWETSTIRSWLNGYGASFNSEAKDYTDNNFLNNAFTFKEQSDINTTNVITNTNIYGIDSGAPTQDKLFFLSVDEIMNPSYGFPSSYSDNGTGQKTRIAALTPYTTYYNAYPADGWLLRSAGWSPCQVAVVNIDRSPVRDGETDPWGIFACDTNAVRPALHLNLASSNWSPAGTVSSNGKTEEITPKPPETPTATPSATPTAEPSESPTSSPSEFPSSTPSTSPDATPTPETPAPSPTISPELPKKEQDAADKFVDDYVTDPNGNIITEVTDLTRDIIVSGEDDWKRLSTLSQKAVDTILQKAGSKYIYEQLLKMAKSYKIPGFKVIKFMKRNSKAKLKLINCKDASIICLSSNPKVATINKKGVIQAKKTGRTTLTFAAVKGIYTNRLIIDLRVKKKFKNANELSGFRSKAIQTPTVLVAKKRLLKQSSKIRVFDLQKSSKVTYTSLNKKILTVNKKGKYTGKKRGSTLVRVKIHQNNKDYLLYVYVTIH